MMEPNEFELRKFVAPEFIFGIDARKLAGRYAKNFGARKVLVVTDPGVTAAGWADDVSAYLREEGLEYAVYSSVTSNPKADEVNAGAELYRRERCNAIVAVGGGSPMDCAKGIGIVSSNKKNVTEFEGVDKVEFPSPPLICIPTTAGSSADVSQFAIITDTRRKAKIAIISKMVVPDVALIDPVTTTTMPPELTACTATDALCHAIEAFVSTAHSPITDVHALQAIRLITRNLLPTLKEPDNIVLRGRMMLASLEAGLAFSNASLGAVHALAHSLGGLLDCPHGECNAILLPYVIDFNFDTVPDRYREIGRMMGLEVSGMAPAQVRSAITSAINRMNEATGISYTLSQLGVKESDIPELAEKAINDACIFTNPRQPTRQDIEAIYEKAL
ncbi:alcohol dehydrogenase-like regulatory protein ErcA [Geotalea uraniireducens]|uniref:Iron-containing alcohol dehydrogenase n=1 Tax=Geotalea uraniireducens (strain Rf4) TaxID=351605 RepID=A5G7B9_GEOUR|nr:alcohol dehydrogenase-like regulatory protein ErcA [Geotalea uraniireducens]ABQ27687.1 iron-containing alcohol dehydrogenase [Geotalea uraniireducens Rf4]